MSKERELLKKCLDFMLDAGANLNPLFKEVNDVLLAQPEQEPVNFDLERMKLAVESPVSGVTVEGLIDKVKSNREHIVDVTDKVEPVAWMQDSIELYVLKEKNILRGYVIPLYLAPPTREPVVYEEEGVELYVSDEDRAVRRAELVTALGEAFTKNKDGVWQYDKRKK